MMKKRATWFTAFHWILSLAANGQVTKKDLIGVWTINNNDSLYFKADTLELYLDANFRYGLRTCNLIEWRIKKHNFSLVDIYTCSEPGRESYSKEGETLTVKKKDKEQVLEIKSKEGKDTFIILALQEKSVDRYPWEIKVLKLKRI